MSKEDIQPSDIKYGIIACKVEKDMLHILHFCGFMSEPTQEEIDYLEKELNTDESLGLVGKMEGVKLIKAPDSYIQHMISKTDNWLLHLPVEPGEQQ